MEISESKDISPSSDEKSKQDLTNTELNEAKPTTNRELLPKSPKSNFFILVTIFRGRRREKRS